MKRHPVTISGLENIDPTCPDCGLVPLWNGRQGAICGCSIRQMARFTGKPNMLADQVMEMIHESPPCQAFARPPVVLLNGEPIGIVDDVTIDIIRWADDDFDPVACIQRMIEEMRSGYSERLMEMTPSALDVKLEGTMTFREFRAFVHAPPDPPGVRYGPYDADPHTKGRRKRFRPQRKA